jgi:hypothetical protein
MTDYFASYLVASRKEGGLLDTSLVISTKEPILVAPTEAISKALISQFDVAGFCSEYFPINGVFYGSETQLFNRSDATRKHEEKHKIISRIWPGAESSFNEGWAYASGYYENNPGLARHFRVLSLKLGAVQERLQTRASNGGLHHEDYALIEDIAADYPLMKGQKNWATLLTILNNVRHYAFFHDTIRNYKGDSDPIIIEAAELARDYGVRTGLEFLAEFVDFDPLFADEEYSPEPTNGQVVISTRPTWSPKNTNIGKVFEAKDDSEFRLSVHSKHQEAIDIVTDVMGTWQPTIEELLGEELIH